MLSSAEKTTVQHVACASKVGSVELDSVPASHAADFHKGKDLPKKGNLFR
jgi:hypothetical protein